jgi:hypothetical protein
MMSPGRNSELAAPVSHARAESHPGMKSVGADPEEREAFVACPFSKASLNRLASGISVFSFVSALLLPLFQMSWTMSCSACQDPLSVKGFSLS